MSKRIFAKEADIKITVDGQPLAGFKPGFGVGKPDPGGFNAAALAGLLQQELGTPLPTKITERLLEEMNEQLYAVGLSPSDVKVTEVTTRQDGSICVMYRVKTNLEMITLDTTFGDDNTVNVLAQADREYRRRLDYCIGWGFVGISQHRRESCEKRREILSRRSPKSFEVRAQEQRRRDRRQLSDPRFREELQRRRDDRRRARRG